MLMRFILTMWYVNIELMTKLKKIKPRFILTMWYVNAKKFSKNMRSLLGFILTMWYVNYIIKAFNFFISYVLY